MEIAMPKLHSRAERREQETDMASNAMIFKNGKLYISRKTFEMRAQ
jgi:hypothetical protein